jgi:hypothetical protein
MAQPFRAAPSSNRRPFGCHAAVVSDRPVMVGPPLEPLPPLRRAAQARCIGGLRLQPGGRDHSSPLISRRQCRKEGRRCFGRGSRICSCTRRTRGITSSSRQTAAGVACEELFGALVAPAQKEAGRVVQDEGFDRRRRRLRRAGGARRAQRALFVDAAGGAARKLPGRRRRRRDALVLLPTRPQRAGGVRAGAAPDLGGDLPATPPRPSPCGHRARVRVVVERLGRAAFHTEE